MYYFFHKHIMKSSHTPRSLFLAVFALMLITSMAQAQTATRHTLRAGDTVRTIAVGSWVSNTPEAENPFDGRVVVLEFWSTWCGPCIKAIPHLNALADEFTPRGVFFAAVSNETATTVRRFTDSTEMRAAVFVDTEKSTTHKHFGVVAIPRTFVIGSDSVVLWTGHPDRLTRELLAALLEGRKK